MPSWISAAVASPVIVEGPLVKIDMNGIEREAVSRTRTVCSKPRLGPEKMFSGSLSAGKLFSSRSLWTAMDSSAPCVSA